MSKQLLSGVKDRGHPTGFDVGIGLGQAGIDDFALSRRVFIIGGGEFGAVDYQPGRDNDLAAPESEVDQVTFIQAGLALDSGRDGHLTFVLDFTGGIHKFVKINGFWKSGIRTSLCGQYSGRAGAVKFLQFPGHGGGPWVRGRMGKGACGRALEN